MELGDIIESALSRTGITKKRAKKWIWFDCRCDKRQEQLNALSREGARRVRSLHTWAKKFLNDETDEKDLEKLMTESCVYLRDAKDGMKTKDGRQVYECSIHSRCVTNGKADEYASCEKCRDRLQLTDRKLGSKFKDPLRVYDRRRDRTDALRDLLAGNPAFLVCGGPSTKQLDIEQLHQRGIFSLAINNVGGWFQPSAFVCSDPPSKFHNAIWMDPKIMKIIPHPKLREKRGRLRKKVGQQFMDLKIGGKQVSTVDCPNVWAFERRSWLLPDETFFTDPGAAWGNHNAGVERTGQRKTVMTMLLGLRILYYLGSRRIYLVGVDFKMDPKAGLHDNYSFGEKRDEGAVRSNNSQFSVINSILCEMTERKIWDRFGVEIYNVNPHSGLEAFSHVPFDVAVMDAVKHIPKVIDLEGWYEKK